MESGVTSPQPTKIYISLRWIYQFVSDVRPNKKINTHTRTYTYTHIHHCQELLYSIKVPDHFPLKLAVYFKQTNDLMQNVFLAKKKVLVRVHMVRWVATSKQNSKSTHCLFWDLPLIVTDLHTTCCLHHYMQWCSEKDIHNAVIWTVLM